jgi:hypothetical protein
MEYTDEIRMNKNQVLWEPLVTVLAKKYTVIDEVTGEKVLPEQIDLWRHWTTVQPPPKEMGILEQVQLNYWPEGSYQFYSARIQPAQSSG